ncbi:MAG: DUF4416 family protein [Sedimentisphaerales bacterium]|jgi:hypothetical protein|nr:DUF4416 family protein [Sedimentisphaerales bacterium]HNY76638.1 DUF4416 family protein [Sedimentisphaerales bacterium]HOC61755.1 DUF4416 family protein [Sedimentisphaerales bacterium]HOH62587.1 DUF4416 family protein [Sedimentisphaerales bacterium]HPY51764.1 DUF4416 family protein [Sedimentisphaerales bacterium]
MWEPKEPNPVKYIVGILARDECCLGAARDAVASQLGPLDLISDIWPFEKTDYYRDQTGPAILRQFISLERLADPGELAQIKHRTNRIEQELAAMLAGPYPRPVNLDPGIIEPSKLVLATTKNYAHRVYIGAKMYAEVTLVFDRGAWCPLPYTYPDYRQQTYFDFFSEVRVRLLQQRKSETHEK